MKFKFIIILTFLLFSMVSYASERDSISHNVWSISLMPYIGNSYVFNNQLQSVNTISLKPYWYFSGQIAVARRLNKKFSIAFHLNNMTIGKRWIFNGAALYQTGNSVREHITYIYKYNFMAGSIKGEYNIGKKKNFIFGLGAFCAYNYSNYYQTDQYGPLKESKYNKQTVHFKNLYGICPSVRYSFLNRKRITLGVFSEFFYSINPLYNKGINLNSKENPYSVQYGLCIVVRSGVEPFN